MSCSTCIQSLPLNKCSDEIIIGIYAPGGYVSPEVDITVLIKNLSTDRISSYEVTTVEGGLIKLDTSELKFNENNLYEISVAEEDYDNIFSEQPFVIEGLETEITCVLVRFKPVFSGASLLNVTSQTITYNGAVN